MVMTSVSTGVSACPLVCGCGLEDRRSYLFLQPGVGTSQPAPFDDHVAVWRGCVPNGSHRLQRNWTQLVCVSQREGCLLSWVRSSTVNPSRTSRNMFNDICCHPRHDVCNPGQALCQALSIHRAWPLA